MKEYEEDPLYLKVSPGRTIPLALAPPPVASLKCIYGLCPFLSLFLNSITKRPSSRDIF